MSIDLQDFAAGDTNYVAKMNSNNAVLEGAVGALQEAAGGSTGSLISLATAYAALFGDSIAVIGSASYACTDGGSGLLDVAAGYAYVPSLLAVVNQAADSSIDFTGQPAATYYIHVDSTGAPSRDTSPVEALYSVVWTGSAFGAITRLAAIVWGAEDWIAAQTSTALSATYSTLDERLEAVEALAGTSAGTVTSVDITPPAAGITATGGPIVSSGSITLALNHDLAAVEGLAAIGIVRRTATDTWSAGTLVSLTSEVTGVLPVANFATGTPTGSKFVRDDGVLAVPAGTSSGTVTSVNITAPAAGITASGGPVTSSGSITLALANDLAALEALASTGFAKRTAADTWSVGALTYSDLPTGVPGKPRVDAHTYASSVTLDAASYDVFEITLTGNITIDFTGGTDGQRLLVRLTQDGTGSRTVTWGSGVGFGTDIATAVASTTASKVDYFGLIYSSASSKYHMVAVARGY